MLQFMYAQQGSYLYIEPIRGLPCKVILNEKEIQPVTRQYFLLPLQGPGEYTVDIVFGGGQIPKQRFVVDLADGCAYGYKLAKAGENRYYLLDLVNPGRVVETNTAVNLALTTEDNVIRFFDPAAPAAPDAVKKQGLFRRRTNTPDQTPARDTVSVKAPAYGVVQVITAGTDSVVRPPVKKTASRCVATASEAEVAAFAEKLSQKGDDEGKLILIRKKIFSGCLSCRQAYALTEILNTQYARFAALKVFRASLADPENMQQWESLFKGESYRSRLKELL
jgi:hypothetical protein